MAERIHRYAAGEIEIALTVGRDQPRTFAALERDIDPGKNRQHVGLDLRLGALAHDDLIAVLGWQQLRVRWCRFFSLACPETKRAARKGGTHQVILLGCLRVST